MNAFKSIPPSEPVLVFAADVVGIKERVLQIVTAKNKILTVISNDYEVAKHNRGFLVVSDEVYILLYIKYSRVTYKGL